MVKHKATIVQLLGLAFGVILCIQIGLYLITDLFAPFITINIFQICMNLFEQNTIAYYFMLFIVNSYVIYTILIICTKVAQQNVSSKQLQMKIALHMNEELTVKYNAEFNRNNHDIYIINYSHPVAFTMGFHRPVIVLSSALIDMLDVYELEAVVYHETAHQINHDPLKLFLLQLISEVMWYIPITKWSFQNYKIMIELLADEYAITRTGNELGLGSALLKLIKTNINGKSTPVLVSFANGTVDYRLKQLIEPSDSIPVKIQKRSLFISIYVLFLLIIVMIIV